MRSHLSLFASLGDILAVRRSRDAVPEFEELFSPERLCREVRYHLIGTIILRTDVSPLYPVPYEEISDFDVFCSARA